MIQTRNEIDTNGHNYQYYLETLVLFRKYQEYSSIDSFIPCLKVS